MTEEGESLINKPGEWAPIFHLNLEFALWQIRFDGRTGLMAVECRDADTLQTSFSVFEGKTGKMILEGFKPPKAWWISLADLRDGLMYLQGVAAKGVGRSAGIWVVEVENGQLRWQRPEFSFYGLTTAELLVLPAEGDTTEIISLNPETGEEISLAGNIAAVQERIASFQEQRNKTVIVPQHYPAENRYFADLSLFLKEKTGFNAQGAFDYLENQNAIVLGFYLQQENSQKTYRLTLFSLTGELYLQEDLGKDLAGMGTDNFFIFQDTLILVKNKKSLLGYAV